MKRARWVNATGHARGVAARGAGCARQNRGRSSSRHEMALGKSRPRDGDLDCRVFRFSSCRGDGANAECMSHGKQSAAQP